MTSVSRQIRTRLLSITTLGTFVGIMLMAAPACAQEASVPADATPSAEVPTDQAPADATQAESETKTEPQPESPTAKPKAEEEEIPLSSQPYVILTSIAFEGQCLVDADRREEIVEDVRRSLARIYGRLWNVECRQNEWIVPGGERHLRRLQLEDVLERYPETEVHKVFLVTVEGNRVEFRVSCREYDSRIQELTPVSKRSIRDPRAIGATAARMMRDIFRPTLMFVRSVPDESGLSVMEMQLQGGEIIPPDPSANQVVPGDVLRPFVRQMDRRDRTKLVQLRALPLTYLKITDIDMEETRGLATAVYISHLRAQLFGAKGRRTQHMAVRQRPGASRSRVRLVLKNQPDKPLISHRLALAYQLNWKSEEDGPQTQLVSDRDGQVVIETRADHPTFWIRVYSGSSLLARVPYAPGLIPFDTIELPDDSIRLGVEGEIQLLSDELIDAIALRSVLMARCRKAAEAGDAKQVDALLATYENVNGKDYFLEQASNIRITAEKRAAAKGLRASLINKLCKSFSDTVENFFTDQKRAERQAEIQQIKVLVQQKADAAGS